MEREDILVVRQEKQTFALKVLSAGSIIKGTLVKNSHYPNQSQAAVEVLPQHVLVNLGKNPRPGSVYGVDVTHVIGKKYHDDFGQIFFMYKPKKEVGEALMKSFSIAASKLKKAGLGFAVGDGIWEVRSADEGGKYAGKYVPSRNEKMPPVFAIRPEKCAISDFPYVVYHEMAHHIHKRYVTSTKLQAKWIQLFNTSIKLQSIPKAESLAIMEMALGSEGPLQDVLSDMSDDQQLAFRHIMKLIRQDHSVSLKELNLLKEAEQLDEIRDLWPQRTIHKKELAPVVSEYATKAVDELIAESIAFYLSGKKLPVNISTLVEKTLSHAKSNQ